MNSDNFTKPTLIEPGVKYFLNQTFLTDLHQMNTNWP